MRQLTGSATDGELWHNVNPLKVHHANVLYYIGHGPLAFIDVTITIHCVCQDFIT